MVDLVRLDDYTPGRDLAAVEANIKRRGMAKTSLVRARLSPAEGRLALKTLAERVPVKLPTLDYLRPWLTSEILVP